MLVSKFHCSLTRPGVLGCIRSRLFYSSKDEPGDNVEGLLLDITEVGDSTSKIEEHVLEDKKIRTRGKKLRPTKANIVVLDPKQAGLLRRRRTPNYFKKNQEKLSILEGVELGVETEFNTRQTSDSRKSRDERQSGTISSSDILQEIEAQRKRLLVFKSSVSKEQAVRSIDHQKPCTTVMSRRRYDQLRVLLDSAYTLPQLRAYTKKHYGAAHSRTTKTALIKVIMDGYWKCESNDLVHESEDLILERIIDVETRDMYLLLLTNNGKILNNFSRIGATLAVALDENVMIVRATAPIIKYVEVSLSNILDNVNTCMMPVRKFIQNHSARGKAMSRCDFNELISLIQRESAAYFELSSVESESTENIYRISAFGDKRLSKAHNLLLWGIQYRPQLSQKVELCSDGNVDTFRKFPFTDIECLDWINRNKEWYRLQKPVAKKSLQSSLDTEVKSAITEEKLDKWYDFLVEQSDKSTSYMMPLKLDNKPKQIFSLTLGQFLTTPGNGNSEEQTLFECRIPQVTTKLLELPLYDSLENKEDLYTVDQHDYYVQLSFIPDLSGMSNPKENAPPIELWFELDEYDNAVVNSARCLTQLQQRNLFLQTPEQTRDLKVSLDVIAELTETFEENHENWLSHQPGIIRFLQDAQLTFHSKRKLVIPKSMNVSLPGESGIVNVQYDYVNATYHRILRLMYKDKYVVQFSDVKGGSSGSNYTQVDFVGGECLSRQDFKQFVKDVSQFV